METKSMSFKEKFLSFFGGKNSGGAGGQPDEDEKKKRRRIIIIIIIIAVVVLVLLLLLGACGLAGIVYNVFQLLICFFCWPRIDFPIA